MKLKDIPPDYAARKVLIAAYIYYVLDDNIMSDERYDRLSRYVCRHWDELNPDRQWCMVDKQQTASTGMHFRFSSACASAALNYYKYKTGIQREFPIDFPWKHAKTGTRKGMAYCTAASPKPPRLRHAESSISTTRLGSNPPAPKAHRAPIPRTPELQRDKSDRSVRWEAVAKARRRARRELPKSRR